MENSHLNQAHFYSRRADAHLRYRRFDEAIECHQKSADSLDETLKVATVPLAIESIKLQKQYHIKQKELIRIKKLQYEKYKVAIDSHKLQKLSEIEIKSGRISKNRIENSCQLQLAIYKTMEEADSLLEILSRKGSDTDSLKSLESDLDDIKINRDESNVKFEPSTSECGIGSKKQKDESIVIEELRTLNHQLHIMVFQLVTQLDESLQEADALRDRVELLERKKVRLPNQLSQDPSLSTLTIKDTRTEDDISPDAIETQEFPALAPLELPNFDYESFSSQSIADQLPK